MMVPAFVLALTRTGLVGLLLLSMVREVEAADWEDIKQRVDRHYQALLPLHLSFEIVEIRNEQVSAMRLLNSDAWRKVAPQKSIEAVEKVLAEPEAVPRHAKYSGSAVLSGDVLKATKRLGESDPLSFLAWNSELSVLRSNAFGMTLTVIQTNHADSLEHTTILTNAMFFFDERPGSWLPVPLVHRELASLMDALSNVSVGELTNRLGRMVIPVSGMLLGRATEQHWTLHFDTAAGFLPLLMERSDDSGVQARFEIEPKTVKDGFWMPGSVRLQTFYQGEIEYQEIYQNIEYATLTEEINASLALEIPYGALVHETRFEKPFSYIMGTRLPTEAELSEMSHDRLAIARYERATRMTFEREQWLSGRRTLLAAATLLLLASVPLAHLLTRSLKRS